MSDFSLSAGRLQSCNVGARFLKATPGHTIFKPNDVAERVILQK